MVSRHRDAVDAAVRESTETVSRRRRHNAGARVRFRDYGNSEDVSLSDLRAKGDDRDAVIAQLRADLAAQPRSSEDALRDTELSALRAELASYKDAEQRASLLEETVASQAEEIRRLSEAKPPDASAVFGAEPDAAARITALILRGALKP